MIIDLGLIVLTFVIGASAALVSTYLMRRLALRFDLVSYPGGRRIHARPTPFLGGVAICFGFSLAVCAVYFTNAGFSQALGPKFHGLMFAGVFIVTLGLVDDIKNIRPVAKLIGQIAAALVLFMYGFKVSVITNPFSGKELVLPVLASGSLTVLWMIGLMNAMNLIDGLDGLAAGITVIVCGALAFSSLFLNNYVNVILLVALGASALGFLRYNFHPAKIFMGDAGSMFLGMVLAAVALIGNEHKSTTATALLIPFAALTIPISDVVVSIIRRIFKKQPIFHADKKHLHHRLLEMGLKQDQIALLAYLATFYFGIFSFLFVLIPDKYAVILLALLAFGMFMAIRLLGFVERRIKLVYRLETRREKRRLYSQDEPQNQ